MDCSKSYGPDGCNGGWEYDAFRYVKDNGISTLSTYPYHGVVSACKKSSTSRVNMKVTGYTRLPETEAALQQAVGKQELLKFYPTLLRKFCW